MRLSITSRLLNRPRFWNVRRDAELARSSAGDCPMSSSPSRRIAPSCGRYTPLRQLKIDVLPAPFGPMTANSSPGCTSKLTSVERGDAAEAQGDAARPRAAAAVSVRRSTASCGGSVFTSRNERRARPRPRPGRTPGCPCRRAAPRPGPSRRPCRSPSRSRSARSDSAIVAFCSTSRTLVPCALISHDDLADLLDDLRRQAERRLVEQQQPRRRPSARGRWRASAARRPRGSRPIALRRSASTGNSAHDPLVGRRRSSRLVAPGEAAGAQVLVDGELGEDAPALHHLATPRRTMAGGVEPVDRCPSSSTLPLVIAPAVDGEQPGDRPQQRRLARPVGAEQRDDAARRAPSRLTPRSTRITSL